MAPANELKIMEPRLVWRKYQRMILNMFDNRKPNVKKLHIVSPPGSGKTIVGIEISRRLGERTVVFAPTSTIQMQWKDQVGMFIPPGDQERLNALVSTDPSNLGPINVFTYQLLSTPAEQDDFARAAATERWVVQLLDDMAMKDESEARKRIRDIEKSNPAAYQRELSKHYKHIKDKMLREPDAERSKFIHPNARKLIDDLVGSGVKTIVLDECHHLLDYWAIIVKELISRIDGAFVIGLTATLPSLDDEDSAENYSTLLGEVDFEVPTPAVVKEGNLAPYRDLVYFTRPSSRESEFLRNIQSHFMEQVAKFDKSAEFNTWAGERMSNSGSGGFIQLLSDDHALGLALARFRISKGFPAPQELAMEREVKAQLSVDDWLVLLEDYGLFHLKTSSFERHHRELDEIKSMLKAFGVTLTERGARSSRSPGDVILSLSDSKSEACAAILGYEMEERRDSLRAVVITDFEKKSAGVTRELKSALDPDAGSAARVLRTLVANPETNALDPIMVTGTNVLADSDVAEKLLAFARAWAKTYALDMVLDYTDEEGGISQINGYGSGWKSSTYVSLVTDFFEAGHTKCLVGTRGIFGEGWDSLTLNVLIDLTSASTSTTVQQIRGRSIRLDPRDPLKLAHNWDVVCIAKEFDKGDMDLSRLLKKHRHHYGIADDGRIVKGLYHLDVKLWTDLEMYGIPFKQVHFSMVNARMLAKVGKRAKSLELWDIRGEYQNFRTTSTAIAPEDMKFRTTFVLDDSLRKILRILSLTAIGMMPYILLTVNSFINIILKFELLENESVCWPVLLVLGAVILLVTLPMWILAYRYIKKAYIELPVDSCLLSIAKAVLSSLRETGKISSNQSVDNLRVTLDDRVGALPKRILYRVHLDYSTQEDARIFSDAYSDVLSKPNLSTKYIVRRDETSLSRGFYSAAWFFMRRMFRLGKVRQNTYHPVPRILSRRKSDAEVFARNWMRYIGGSGVLVPVKTQQGVNIIKSQSKKMLGTPKKKPFEEWI